LLLSRTVYQKTKDPGTDSSMSMEDGLKCQISPPRSIKSNYWISWTYCFPFHRIKDTPTWECLKFMQIEIR